MSESAKTPAEPHERKRGSSKNKKGSARSESSGSSITFDEKTLSTLRDKVESQNEKAGDVAHKKTSLSELKVVYRRGAGAFSSSHRPNQNRSSWSMGRVNAFLKILNGRGNPKYTQDNDLLHREHPRKKSTKKSFNQGFRVHGMGATRQLIDARNFPPARPIPLYHQPRINSSSQITEDMPISTSQHMKISKVAEYESDYRVASQKVKDILAGQDSFMIAVILKRLSNHFSMNKALTDEKARSVESGNLIADVISIGDKAKKDHERSKAEQKKEEQRKKSAKKKIKAEAKKTATGYESSSKTTKRSVKAWEQNADEKDVASEKKKAKKYLKDNHKDLAYDDGDLFETALDLGYSPSEDSNLDTYIESFKESQAERNQELVEALTVSRDGFMKRFESDFNKEINDAFSQLPASRLKDYPDLNPNNQKDRQEILAREGFKPMSADPSLITEDSSNEQILAMAGNQGFFDGKVGRKHKFEAMAQAEQWREDSYPDVPSSENVSRNHLKPKPSVQPDGQQPDGQQPDGQKDGDDNVIATGKRGGKIIGYRGGDKSKPIYQKKGAKEQAQPQQTTEQPKQSESVIPEDTFRPVQRRSKVDNTSVDTNPIAKSLQVAEIFCKSIGMQVDRGRLMKSDSDRVLEKLDEAYDKLTHLRMILRPHHTPQHNEVVHLLREAHANPEGKRANHAIEICEHFIEMVLLENNKKVNHVNDMISSKKKVKKAVIYIGSEGLLVRDPRREKLKGLAKGIDSGTNLIMEHNLECSPSQVLSLDCVAKCFARESTVAVALDRVRGLIELAKGEPSVSADGDLLGDEHLLKAQNKSVDELLLSKASPEVLLDVLTKSIKVKKNVDEDDEIDTDSFEDDQDQALEEVDVEPEEEEDDDDKEEGDE